MIAAYRFLCVGACIAQFALSSVLLSPEALNVYYEGGELVGVNPTFDLDFSVKYLDKYFWLTSDQSWLRTGSLSLGQRACICDKWRILVWINQSKFATPGQYVGSITVNSEVFPPKSVRVTVHMLPAIEDSRPKIHAVVNAASSTPGPVAWGALHTIYGENLSIGTHYATGLPWPSSLGGTSVLFCEVTSNCRLLELLFASPNQINFRLSFFFGNFGTLYVQTSEGTSEAHRTEIFQDFLGLFVGGYECEATGTPCNFTPFRESDSQVPRGAITHPDGRLITAQAPAIPGGIYVGWFTGLGIQALPGDNLANRERIRVKLYKVSPSQDYRPTADAEIIYIGQSVEYPGLFQVNFKLPRLIFDYWPIEPTNSMLEVWIMLWGFVSSNSVALPVKTTL